VRLTLNIRDLAADCGITHNTAKAWLSVLEDSYLVALLQPYHRNLGKRLTKTPSSISSIPVSLPGWPACARPMNWCSATCAGRCSRPWW
jgi:hypothetical protein